MVLSFSTNPYNNYYAANSKEFISLDKPVGASPRHNYEDGISMNNFVLTIFYGVGNYIEKGGERSAGYGLIERF